jgi:large-conductance mechanosensitive channel
MRIDLVALAVPTVIGTALGAVVNGKRGAMWGAGIGLAAGGVAELANKDGAMGSEQRILQGGAGLLSKVGLDPIDRLPGGV